MRYGIAGILNSGIQKRLLFAGEIAQDKICEILLGIDGTHSEP